MRRQNCSPGWSSSSTGAPALQLISCAGNTRGLIEALAVQSLHEVRAGRGSPGSAAGDRQTLAEEELCDPLGAAGKGGGDGVR